MTRLTLDEDALARYVHGNRPSVRWTLDVGAAVDLPDPARLAAMLRLPGLDLFARRSALLARPSGSDAEPEPLDPDVLAADLRALLLALPQRPDAEQPYRDLRLAASTDSPRFADYVATVVRRLRDDLPPPPARPRVRAASASRAMTDAERKRAQRDRERLAEAASALYWLDNFLLDPDEPAFAPESLVSARALWRQCREDLDAGALLGEPIDEDDPDSLTFRLPRRPVFLTVVAATLGKPRHTERGTTYTIPTEVDMLNRLSPTTRTIVERAAEILAAEARDEIEALTRQAAEETAASLLAACEVSA